MWRKDEMFLHSKNLMLHSLLNHVLNIEAAFKNVQHSGRKIIYRM